MFISLKEANETEYWLLILKDTDFIDSEIFNRLHLLNKELIAMLVSTIKTVKQNMNSEN